MEGGVRKTKIPSTGLVDENFETPVHILAKWVEWRLNPRAWLTVNTLFWNRKNFKIDTTKVVLEQYYMLIENLFAINMPLTEEIITFKQILEYLENGLSTITATNQIKKNTFKIVEQFLYSENVDLDVKFERPPFVDSSKTQLPFLFRVSEDGFKQQAETPQDLFTIFPPRFWCIYHHYSFADLYEHPKQLTETKLLHTSLIRDVFILIDKLSQQAELEKATLTEIKFQKMTNYWRKTFDSLEFILLRLAAFNRLSRYPTSMALVDSEIILQLFHRLSVAIFKIVNDEPVFQNFGFVLGKTLCTFIDVEGKANFGEIENPCSGQYYIRLCTTAENAYIGGFILNPIGNVNLHSFDKYTEWHSLLISTQFDSLKFYIFVLDESEKTAEFDCRSDPFFDKYQTIRGHMIKTLEYRESFVDRFKSLKHMQQYRHTIHELVPLPDALQKKLDPKKK